MLKHSIPACSSRNRRRIAIGLFALCAAGGIPAFGESTSETSSQDVRELAFADIRLMEGPDLATIRELCVAGRIGSVKDRFEGRYGSGSFPSTAAYCLTAIETAIRKQAVSALYFNLALQDLGIGTEVAFGSDIKAVGDTPLRIVRNIRAAADAGRQDYVDGHGNSQMLSCALALDAGASWGSANPTLARHADFTAEQLGKIVTVCFDGQIEEVTVSTTGETFSVQTIGLLAGEQIGRGIALNTLSTAVIFP